MEDPGTSRSPTTRVQNNIIADNRTSGGSENSGTDVDFAGGSTTSYDSLGSDAIGDGNATGNFNRIAFEQVPGQPPGTNQARVSFAAIPGRTYRIQSTDSLSPANWVNRAPAPAASHAALLPECLAVKSGRQASPPVTADRPPACQAAGTVACPDSRGRRSSA